LIQAFGQDAMKRTQWRKAIGQKGLEEVKAWEVIKFFYFSFLF
jgi:hypothetical protein